VRGWPAILGFVTDLAYLGLAVLAIRDWLLRRGRARRHLAEALGALALVAVLSVASGLTGGRYAAIVTPLVLIAFQASGFALLLFRGAFIPLSRNLTLGALALLAGTVALLLAVGTPSGRPAHPGPLQVAAAMAFVLAWSLCVAEPAVRFFLHSNDRPAVQKNRLRALSLGYLGLVVIVLAAGSSAAANSPGLELGLSLLGLATAPLIYAGFQPPGWLRRSWREREEEKLRAAIDELVLATATRPALAQDALEWAVRLVGAEAAFIIDGDGGLLAASGIGPGAAAEIAQRFEAGALTRQEIADLIVQPMILDSGRGALVAIAGPFTPLFGSDEIGRLRLYAASLSGALDRARAADRIAALEEVKSRFLRLASHELRGPLTLVRGYVSMIADGSLKGEAMRATLPTIMGRLDLMTGMLNEMLETARLEDERMEFRSDVFDLRLAARDAVQAVYPSLAGTHRLELDEPREEILVLADKVKVTTILGNLIDNAIKYSPAGGTVRCGVRAAAAEGLVEVRDEGIGIAAGDMAGLFTRFGRVNSSDTTTIPGTGLGLYLSRELARRMGGDVSADSRPGAGSVFTVSLPLAR
jgi:signal transduction histidine kinase